MLVPFGGELLAAAIHPRGARALALPKGHPEPGETDVQAAEREVREETGVRGRAVAELGQIDYWFYKRSERARVHKTVAFFLFAYLGGNWRDHDAEVDAVRLVRLGALEGALTYRGEREVARRAIAELEAVHRGPSGAAPKLGPPPIDGP